MDKASFVRTNILRSQRDAALDNLVETQVQLALANERIGELENKLKALEVAASEKEPEVASDS